MPRCSHCGLDHPMDESVCPITEESLQELGPCGTTIDRYEIERWLGGGGFGAVYRARHAVMDRTVALKLLHKGSRTTTRARERFFQEAKAAAAIGHPNIVQVFDAGVAPNGIAFLAMELIDGCSLFDLLAVECLPVRRSLEIVLEVLEALVAAHRVGIIHRDVKPGNIMLAGTEVDGSRSEDRVKLVDFGISKVRSHPSAQQFTRSNASMGSPGYAAPEQYVSARDVDVRADVYSVGVVLYRLLSGELPFDADSYEKMIVQVCTEDPPSIMKKLPELDPRLGATIDRALSRDRKNRHESAEAMAAELRVVLETIPKSMPSVRPREAVVSAAVTTPLEREPRALTPKDPVPLEATVPARTLGLSDPKTTKAVSSPKAIASRRRRALAAGAFFAMVVGGAGILWSMDRDRSQAASSEAPQTARPAGAGSADPAAGNDPHRPEAPAASATDSMASTSTSGSSDSSAPVPLPSAPPATAISSPSRTDLRRRPHTKARVVRRVPDTSAEESRGESARPRATDHASSSPRRSGFGAEDLEPF